MLRRSLCILLLLTVLCATPPAGAATYLYEIMRWPEQSPQFSMAQTAYGYMVVDGNGVNVYHDRERQNLRYTLQSGTAVPLAEPPGSAEVVALQLPQGETGYAHSAALRAPQSDEIPAYALDTSTAELGYVYAAARGAEPLLLCIENGETRHHTRIPPDGKWHPFLLTLGEGEYNIYIYQAGVDDRVVSALRKESLRHVAPPDEQILARYSSAHVDMENNPEIVAWAQAATEGVENDVEKFKILRAKLYQNARYDTEYARDIQYTKIPEPSVFLQKGGAGICGDYAAFLSIACRAVGIPCKSISGINPGTGRSHGWNVVLLDGRWRLVDVVSEKSRGQAEYVPLGLAESGYKIVPSYRGGFD